MKLKLKELMREYPEVTIPKDDYWDSLDSIPLHDEIFDYGELVCHYDVLDKELDLPVEIDYTGNYMTGIIHGTIHTNRIIQETRSYPEENYQQIVYHYLINDDDIVDINDINGEQFEDWMLD